MEQINDLHSRLGKKETLFEYTRALKALGVKNYDSFLADGHSEYFGRHGEKVVSPPTHDKLFIADKSDREAFLNYLKLHEEGETTYTGMSRGLAESGIENWAVDTQEMIMVFYDKSDNEILVERIK